MKNGIHALISKSSVRRPRPVRRAKRENKEKFFERSTFDVGSKLDNQGYQNRAYHKQGSAAVGSRSHRWMRSACLSNTATRCPESQHFPQSL